MFRINFHTKNEFFFYSKLSFILIHLIFPFLNKPSFRNHKKFQIFYFSFPLTSTKSFTISLLLKLHVTILHLLPQFLLNILKIIHIRNVLNHQSFQIQFLQKLKSLVCHTFAIDQFQML